MKNIVKIFLIALFFVTSLCVSFAENSEEVIFLNTTEVSSIKVPASPVMEYVTSNQNHEMRAQRESEESQSFSSEEGLTDSKILKSFYNFVDDKLINNKINNYSSSVIDEFDARAP